MTWKELAKVISQMPESSQDDPVVIIQDYYGPDRRLTYLDLMQAWEDVYIGISVGNECQVSAGDWFMADTEEDLAAGEP